MKRFTRLEVLKISVLSSPGKIRQQSKRSRTYQITAPVPRRNTKAAPRTSILHIFFPQPRGQKALPKSLTHNHFELRSLTSACSLLFRSEFRKSKWYGVFKRDSENIVQSRIQCHNDRNATDDQDIKTTKSVNRKCHNGSEIRKTSRAWTPTCRVGWKRLQHFSLEVLQKSTTLQACLRKYRYDTKSFHKIRSRIPGEPPCLSCGTADRLGPNPNW